MQTYISLFSNLLIKDDNGEEIIMCLQAKDDGVAVPKSGTAELWAQQTKAIITQTNVQCVATTGCRDVKRETTKHARTNGPPGDKKESRGRIFRWPS